MAEQFDYLNSDVSAPFNEKLAARSQETFEREVRERAQLMCHLRFRREDTIARLKQNIAWEFDDAWTKKAPSIHAQIEAIVTEVYKHLEGKKD